MFLTALNLSHDFLSAIFGILRKFRIDIGIFFSKHIFFRNEKQSREKKFLRKNEFFLQKQILRFFQLKSHLKSIFQKSILNDFSIEKNLKICFCQKNLIFSQKKKLRYFFSFRKNILCKKKIHTSIRNFIRNPKIILRKSCDEFKGTKNIDSKFFDKFFLILVTCYV